MSRQRRRSGLADLGGHRRHGDAVRFEVGGGARRRGDLETEVANVLAASSPAALSRSARDMNTVPSAGSGVPAAI